MTIVRYELLWNVRKRRIQAVFAIVLSVSTILLFLPPLLIGEIESNPNIIISQSTGPAFAFGGIFIFIFAMVVSMNSISGEFESGSILPLLSKPISRPTIFIGKVIAAFLTLLAAYIVWLGWVVLGGIALYGPQANLHLAPLSIIGSLISSFVYGSIILAIGSVTKSSSLAGFGGLGIWLGMGIAGSIVAATLGPVQVLNYLPGSGAIGYLDIARSPLDSNFADPGPPIQFPGLPTSSGTDNIAGNLLRYALHGNAEVKFVKLDLSSPGQISVKVLAAEPMSNVLLRSIVVSFAYISAFLLLALYAFRRAEVLEST